MKDKTPLSIKLDEGVHERLDECANRTKIKKYSLAIQAIEAAIEAIEQNDFRLVVPIEFKVAHVPTSSETSASLRLCGSKENPVHPVSETKYPPFRSQSGFDTAARNVAVNEDDPKSARVSNSSPSTDIERSLAETVPSPHPAVSKRKKSK